MIYLDTLLFGPLTLSPFICFVCYSPYTPSFLKRGGGGGVCGRVFDISSNLNLKVLYSQNTIYSRFQAPHQLQQFFLGPIAPSMAPQSRDNGSDSKKEKNIYEKES